MGVRSAVVVGIGETSQQALAQLAYQLRQAYDSPDTIGMLCFNLPPQRRQESTVETDSAVTEVILEELPTNWFGTREVLPLPFLDSWLQMDRRRKLRIEMDELHRPSNRQLLRSQLLWHLVESPNTLLAPITTLFKSLLVHTRDASADVYLLADLTDAPALAWYWDIANLLQYVSQQLGVKSRTTAYLALPTQAETDMLQRRVRNAASALFLEELERFQRPHDSWGASPLYPYDAQPIVEYNTYVPLVNVVRLYDGAATHIETDHLIAQWVDAIMPMLDTLAGSSPIEGQQNRSAQQFSLQSNGGLFVESQTTTTIFLPRTALRRYWSHRLILEALVPTETETSRSDLLGDLKEFTQQRSTYIYPSGTRHDIRLPVSLSQLLAIMKNNKSLTAAGRQLAALDNRLVLSWLNVEGETSEVLTWEPDEAKALEYAEGNHVQDFRNSLEWRIGVYVGDASLQDRTSGEYYRLVRGFIQREQTSLEQSLVAFLHDLLGRHSLDSAADVMNTLRGSLTELQSALDLAASQQALNQDSFSRMQRLGKGLESLTMRSFIQRKPKLSENTIIYLNAARGYLRTFRRWQNLLFLSELVKTGIERIDYLLGQLHYFQPILGKGGDSALRNLIRAHQPALPKIEPEQPRHVLLNDSWADRYYSEFSRPLVSSLREAQSWRWEVQLVTQLDTLRLRLVMFDQLVETAEEAARIWLEAAERLVAERTVNLRIWNVIAEQQNMQQMAEVLGANLVILPETLKFNPSRQLEQPTRPVQSLTTAHAVVNDVAVEKFTRALEQWVENKTQITTNSNPSTDASTISLVRTTPHINVKNVIVVPALFADAERLSTQKRQTLCIFPGELERETLRDEREFEALISLLSPPVLSVLDNGERFQLLMQLLAVQAVVIDPLEQDYRLELGVKARAVVQNTYLGKTLAHAIDTFCIVTPDARRPVREIQAESEVLREEVNRRLSLTTQEESSAHTWGDIWEMEGNLRRTARTAWALERATFGQLMHNFGTQYQRRAFEPNEPRRDLCAALALYALKNSLAALSELREAVRET